MLDTRERLAKHVYGSALDIDPDAAVALRIDHASGLTWHIEDGYMRLKIGATTNAAIPLTGTISDLRSALVARGVIIRYVNPDVLHLASGALLEGSGSGASSSTDQLKVFQSDLWTMLDAYGVVVDQTDKDVVEGIAQLYVNTATDDILDYWGEYFGVPREADENDTDYRIRMIVEVLRPKSNKIAIENAASAIAGVRVELYEPWTDLFYLSVSKLDNERTFNGHDWSPYVFRPIYRGYNNINWSRVLPVIEKLRPAGVLMLDPEWIPSPRYVESPDVGMGYAMLDRQSQNARYDDRMLLDSYHLGDPVTQNYGVLKYDLYSNANFDQAIGPTLGLHPRRSFVRGQLVLSDMDEPLGDLRARFTGVYVRYLNTPFLSDFRLSDFDPGKDVLAPEDVYTPNNAYGGDGNVRPETKAGRNTFTLRSFNLFAYDSTKPKVVGLHVVTAKFLEAKPTEQVVFGGWANGWGADNWNTQYPISGVCINVITENL